MIYRTNKAICSQGPFSRWSGAFGHVTHSSSATGVCSVVFADVCRIPIYKSMTTVQLYCPYS